MISGATAGWRMIADTEETKEKLIVFFLEPENGVWQHRRSHTASRTAM